MRYCPHCGYVFDEFDYNRKWFNCTVCDAILKEDDMTALKFAQLSEDEKDEYERQLVEKMRNEVAFSEEKFQRWNSMKNGDFWRGFRLDKYAEFNSKEDVDFYMSCRKAKEPFQPFPPMDKEKARQHTHDVVMERKQMEENLTQKESNQVVCPYCKSANVRKITITNKAVHTAIFGLWSMGRNSKNYHCDHCGADF